MFLASVDKLTKWITSVTVALVAVTYTTPDNVTVAVYVACSILNAFVSRGLKRLI